MNFLLDTHVFIWMDIAPNHLSDSVVKAIQDPANTIYLSLVSVWEIQIKMQIGKLKLNAGLQSTVELQEKTNRLVRLPITFDHIVGLDKLELHHRDPFDRLLIAQTQTESLTLITNDTNIQKYAITWLW
jgi:PIN domain nuclease of toxin-antitoxin system